MIAPFPAGSFVYLDVASDRSEDSELESHRVVMTSASDDPMAMYQWVASTSGAAASDADQFRIYRYYPLGSCSLAAASGGRWIDVDDDVTLQDSARSKRQRTATRVR